MHESITKHDGNDIASSFIKWLMQPGIRDQRSITAWLDNCGSQGKNSIIYKALVSCMCSGLAELCTLTLRYFEKGHTFMCADSYHHSVEKAMKQKKNVYDISDFIECLNVDGQAAILSHNDLFTVATQRD